MTIAQTKPKTNKDRVVNYRCEPPLIADFDRYAAKANRTRSEVLRELMSQWLQERKTA